MLLEVAEDVAHFLGVAAKCAESFLDPAVRQFDTHRPVTAAEPEVQGATCDLQPCAEVPDRQQIALPRRLTL